MELSLNWVKNAVWFILLVISVVGTYWKLRVSIQQRPTHEKVEKMMAREIENKCYPREDGIRIEGHLESADLNIARIERKLDEIAEDLKQLLRNGKKNT